MSKPLACCLSTSRNLRTYRPGFQRAITVPKQSTTSPSTRSYCKTSRHSGERIRCVEPSSSVSKHSQSLSTSSNFPYSSKRPYFTATTPEEPSYGQTEAAILSAALEHVPEHGFTQQALTLGAQAAGYPAVSTNLITRGPFDLVLYHLITSRQALKSHASTTDEKPDVQSLIIARLHLNEPVISHLAQALAIITTPSNLPTSLAELARLADEIMYLSGDTSVDSTWYAKRAAVAATYAASEVFMTQDASMKFIETDNFAARRLEDTSRVGRAGADAGEFLGFAGAGAVNVLRSWGVRI